MLKVFIKSIGILAPGMPHWQGAIKVFTGAETYGSEPVAKKLDTLLPPNERRRATRITQLALNVAQQACQQIDASQCLQVFSSSNGDLMTFHRISQALAMPGRAVSPTLFHNSVHNAPAGYWSIATQAKTPSTSITAYTDSFSAGLLEAAVQLNSKDNEQNRDCLLVCYDEIPPSPFQLQTRISEEFACAFVLSTSVPKKSADNSLCQLEISIGDGQKPVTASTVLALEKCRQANPQAASLPLFEQIACQTNKDIILPYFEQGLHIRIKN